MKDVLNKNFILKSFLIITVMSFLLGAFHLLGQWVMSQILF